MLDIALFREGADLELVKNSQRFRCSIVSKIKALAAAMKGGDPAEIGAAQKAHDEALARQKVSFPDHPARHKLRSNYRRNSTRPGNVVFRALRNNPFGNAAHREE